MRPAYNLQASVDSENQIVVAMKLTQSENDHGFLPEMVEEVESNLGLSPDVCLADTGYVDEKTWKWIEETGHNTLMPPQKPPRTPEREGFFANVRFLKSADKDVLICPAGRELVFRGEYKKQNCTYRRYSIYSCRNCSLRKECIGENGDRRVINISIVAEQRDRMRAMLESEEGKLLYQLRQETSEPVFGRMKVNMGLWRFLLRGVEGATAESALAFLAHNVLKCVASASAMSYLRANKVALRGLACVSLVLDVFNRWLRRQFAARTVQRCIAGFSF